MNSLQGGSDPRTPDTTGKLQVLQKFSVPSVEKGSTNLSSKDSPIYVEMESHTSRIEVEEKGSEKSVKKKKNEGRKLEDGLLLVFPMRIYGKAVKALIDSGATKCFVTPSCVIAVVLKGFP